MGQSLVYIVMKVFESRIATKADYRAVRRLCIRAVGEDDYVIPRLRNVISHGGLFLAFSGKELVGMSNFSVTLDRAGWFGMVRTDPLWRRQGVAIFLQKVKTRHARKLGIRKLRMFILSANGPSLGASKKGGFRRVGESAHMTKQFQMKGVRAKYLFGSNDSLMRSTYVAKMNGYFAYDGTFVKMDSKVVEELERRREVYSTRGSTFILNSVDEFEVGRHREFALLGGSFEAGLKDIVRTASSLGSSSVGTFIPYENYLISKARKFGFVSDDWGWHCILFEKRI
ncbi:MAG TPA: GNAT family N-acetyltransferase [Nitrososphaerales archaeon]|nr:GNAT family N-acetyltransferase [Nitrososphaerales archaeon]